MTAARRDDEADVLDRMLRFVDEAAPLALAMRADGLRVGQKGDDLAQVLTDTDEAISRLMHARFAPRLIEEESAAALTREAIDDWLAPDADTWTYIGDPIDGTAPFAGGLSGWGTMIAACRRGWPVVGVMALPAWTDHLHHVGPPISPGRQRGLLLAGTSTAAYWAPLRGGRRVGPLRPLEPQVRQTRHVGWTTIAAQHYVLDYTIGAFPICAGGFIAEAALLATGRLDAATFCAKLWDLAPTLPILERLGFALRRWPEAERVAPSLGDLFGRPDLSCGENLYLLTRSAGDAARLASAIRRAADMVATDR